MLFVQFCPLSCNLRRLSNVKASQKSSSSGVKISSIVWMIPLQAIMSGITTLASLNMTGLRLTSTVKSYNNVSVGPAAKSLDGWNPGKI